MSVDQHLHQAFGKSQDPGFEPASVSTIRKRAQSRRRRRVVAVAACALAVVAGLGSFVSPGRTEVPSAVFASQRAGADGEEDASSRDVIRPSAETLLTIGSTFDELDTEQFDSLVPDPGTITVGPKGEFVGVARTLVRGTRESSHLILRSSDGQQWTASHRWDLGAYQLDSLWRSGSGWAAVLSGPNTIEFDANGQVPQQVWDKQIAVSDDLGSWSHFALELDLRDKVAASGADLSKVRITPAVTSVGRMGSLTFAQVTWWIQPSRAALREGCGFGDDDRGLFLINCDGTVDLLLDATERSALGFDSPALFVASGDTPLAELPAGPAWPVVATDDYLVSMDESLRTLIGSVDGAEWNDVTTLPSPGGGVWAWMMSPDSHGNVVGLRGVGSNAQQRLATVDVEAGSSLVRSLPLQVDPAVTAASLSHGESGWAVVIAQRERGGRPLVTDDWSLDLWPQSLPGRDGLWLAPTQPGYRPRYVVDPASSLVEVGLFGEVRVEVPGTGERAVDADGVWWLLDDLPFTVPPEPGASFESDGWTVTGDPSLGPLVVTDPDGTERVFSDGYSFVNGSVDDGVELIGSDATSVVPRGGTLAVYDDGEVAWSAPFDDVVAELGLDVDVFERIAPPEPGDAWLATSVDGDRWSIVWQKEEAGLGDFPSVLVGDGEALVMVEGGYPIQRSEVIELPD